MDADSVPDYEQLLQEIYESHLQPGDVAIDVGAHTGRHAIPMAMQVGAGGKVIAYEPLPSCREELARRLHDELPDQESVIVLRAEALADYEGESEFNVVVGAPWFSGLKERGYDIPRQREQIQVEVKRLDSCLAELSSLAYIKVDAEGGELGVLRGAVETLDRFRPLVSFEFGSKSIWAYEITPCDMAAFWCRLGYRLYDVLGRSLSRDRFILSAVQQKVWDYIAVPLERTDLPEQLFRRA